MIEMKIAGVAMDTKSNMPIIILKDKEGKRILPIWIGIFEAQSILIALEGVKLPRPLTHDLLQNMLQSLGARVTKVVINALKDNTYFAKINLLVNDNVMEIDSRPSDAIALALRASAPIYVVDPVINAATMPSHPIDDEEVKRFKEMLKDIKPEDFKG
jgi:hypothetical protein